MALGLALLVATALLPRATALAHEQRDVGDGKYSVEVGFRDEPAYLAQANAFFLKVTKFGSDGGPVAGLAATLEAEVEKGGVSRPLELVPQPEAGVYTAEFIPTALGDYAFRLVGEIEGAPIDESFTSSPTTFASVEPIARVQFPVPVPAGEVLSQQLEELEIEATNALVLSRVGIVVGALGLLAAATTHFRRRPPTTPPPTSAALDETGGLIRRDP